MKTLTILMTAVIVGAVIAVTILSIQLMGAACIVPLVMCYALFGTCLALVWNDETADELRRDIRAALQEWSNCQAAL